MAVVVALALSSCSLTARKYVARYSAYDVTSGTIVEVDELQVVAQDHLADGVAMIVGGDGCRVKVYQDGETLIYDVEPESLLVAGPGVDYLVRPQGSGPGVSRTSAENVADAATAAETQSLMEESNRVLDLLPVLSEAEVRREIDRLALSFETHDDVAGIRALLLSRLERRMRGGETGAVPEPPGQGPGGAAGGNSIDPAEARKLLVRAKALVEEKKTLAAIPLLEQAYVTDPESPEVAGLLAKLLKNVGLDLYSKGRWEEAIPYWRRVVAIFPDDEEAKRFLDRAREVKSKM